MSKRILWITETAVMLALLITLQTVTKPINQLVTGSCVNAVLAAAALVGGLGSGITVALISPVLAFLLGIAPQILTVPAIMAGNCVYVVALSLLADKTGRKPLRQAIAWLAAAFAKFVTLYLIVVKLICGLLAESLPGAGKLAPAAFSWPQLVTALIGGGVVLLILPVLRKALKK